MKAFFLGLFLASSVAHAAPVLSKIEEEDLLKSIDDICGDSWCEGDSNWSFDAMPCDSETGCVLDLTMKPYDFDEDQVLTARPFQCSLPAFKAKASLAEETVRGLQYTEGLYAAVSDCISNLNDNYGPIYVPIDSKCSSLFNPKTASFSYETTQDVNSSGVYAAVEAVSKIVLKQSKIDATCQLAREPFYRDSAACVNAKNDLTQEGMNGSEVCILPSVNGSFKVTPDDLGSATVEYLPGKLGNQAYKSKTHTQIPAKHSPANKL